MLKAISKLNDKLSTFFPGKKTDTLGVLMFFLSQYLYAKGIDFDVELVKVKAWFDHFFTTTDGLLAHFGIAVIWVRRLTNRGVKNDG